MAIVALTFEEYRNHAEYRVSKLVNLAKVTMFQFDYNDFTDSNIMFSLSVHAVPNLAGPIK